MNTSEAINPAAVLLRRDRTLEWLTLGRNIAGICVLAVLAISASSVALVGFGLDSLIKIGASTVVLWELSSTGEQRHRRALRLIGIAFGALVAYLLVQSALALVTGHHASPSWGGIGWTAVTAAVMFTLTSAKSRTGSALSHQVLITEGRVGECLLCRARGATHLHSAKVRP